MVTSLLARRVIGALHGNPPSSQWQRMGFMLIPKSNFGGIKFLDDKRTGEENVYFRKEDEMLLKNLIANHPEYDLKYNVDTLTELGEISRDIQLACKKHGVNAVSIAFIKDLVNVFETHGWSKSKK